MLDSKGTVSSRMIIFREGKSITRSGRKEVQRTLGGIVEPVGRGQSDRSARIVGRSYRRVRRGQGLKEVVEDRVVTPGIATLL